MRFGLLAGPVRGPAVDDEDFTVRADGIDDFADQTFLVLGGNDDCDGGSQKRQYKPLSRSPSRR
jgi:hypothetical protein